MASHHSEMLSIPLSALQEGVSVFTFRASFPDGFVQEHVGFKGFVEIKVTVTQVQEDLLFSVGVKGEGKFVCDRCGKDFNTIVEGSVQTLYTFDPLKIEDDSTGDVQLLAPKSSNIDITQDVKDALLLAIPRKRLCKSSCAGLCPKCGADLNKKVCSCSEDSVDPRWEGLKKLRS